MGTYVNGGQNEIGIAVTDSWVAVWTVDTPYIEVITRGFYDAHADEIRKAAELGQGFSGGQGQTGVVAVIGTDGDLDTEGWPKGYDDASEYVADELSAWTRSDGGAYERAVAEGYGR